MTDQFTLTVTHRIPSRDGSRSVNPEVDIIVKQNLSNIIISAFDGEVQISIHTSFGHYKHWHVVVVCCDASIKHASSAEYSRETKLEDAFDAITKILKDDWEKTFGEGSYINTWWQNGLEELKSKLLG